MITEIEENTPRISSSRAIDERLETEQVDNTETYKIELNIWVHRAVSYLFFFIVLQISTLAHFSFAYSLIPLFILDTKIIINTLLNKSGNFKSNLFNNTIIHQLCSLTFKVLVFVHSQIKTFNALFLLIPIGALLFSQFLNKPKKNSDCKYLVWIIMSICELLFFLTILNVALYLQGFIGWNSAGILWPVYLGLSCCGIIIVGLVLFTVGSFLSWMEEDISTKEFLTSFWLLLSTVGSSGSIISLCIKIEGKSSNKLDQYFCIVPIVYLILFIFFTKNHIFHIILWWKEFFSSNLTGESLDLPEPASQAIASTQVTRSFQSRISKTIKKAPHVLMRISSSYFKPAEIQPNLSIKRTLSLKQDLDKVDETELDHKRNLSNPIKIEVLSPDAKSSLSKKCDMCYERYCDAVIMECGHGGICYECCLEIWKTVGYCHMCRGNISQVLQIESCENRIFRVCSTTKVIYNEENMLK